MSIICIAKGTATIGMTTRGADGKIISQTPARWEHDPDGGCVALWTMNPETEEQEAPARIYGDWHGSPRIASISARPRVGNLLTKIYAGLHGSSCAGPERSARA